MKIVKIPQLGAVPMSEVDNLRLLTEALDDIRKKKQARETQMHSIEICDREWKLCATFETGAKDIALTLTLLPFEQKLLLKAVLDDLFSSQKDSPLVLNFPDKPILVIREQKDDNDNRTVIFTFAFFK